MCIRVVPGCASSGITFHTDVSVVPTTPSTGCSDVVSLTLGAHIGLKQVGRDTRAVNGQKAKRLIDPGFTAL